MLVVFLTEDGALLTMCRRLRADHRISVTAMGIVGRRRAVACENELVVTVARLLTFVDVADEADDGPDARRLSVSARHEAVLADGRRVLLLDDRGWSAELGLVRDDEPSEEARALVELPSIWLYETVEDMERTARDVVGPDEAFGGRTRADMDASHWDSLARVLQQ